jgi:signal transduction histidine kinase/CheY-like chemotaxis protein
LVLPYKFFFTVFNKYNITYTTTAVSIIVGMLSLTVIVFTTILAKKYKSKLDQETKKNCYLIAYNTSFAVVQMIFPNIAIYPFASVLIITIIYLSFSNPDIEMQKELIKAKESIKRSSRAKAEFLSNVTSEIKTPVSYITSLCTNLESLQTYDTNEIKKIMQQVILSGNNLLDIVNNVLDISRIESGNTSLIENEYKIKDIIDDAVSVAKSKIGSKPVNLEVKISPTLATSYAGDAGKIYQAILNILTNAAKYTEVGKITFEVTNSKAPLGEKLLFKVTDTGNGIKEEDKEKIFIKGTRLNNSIESEIEGSGYGLAITKEYLDLIEGKIWFESEYHVGTTFYIELVQKVVDATPIKLEEEKENIVVSNIDCTGLVALVLDDNKLNVKVIKRLLERYGFKVVSVGSGQECIYKIKSEEHFDIVFMDQVMEDMTGTDTMKALRGLEGYKIPPLVLLTANAVSGMREKYIEEGFDDYIPKPITTPELEELINKYFKKTN